MKKETITRKYQRQILRDLKCACKRYLEEREYVLYRSRMPSLFGNDDDKLIKHTRDLNRSFAEEDYKEILNILETYDLSLLQSWWYFRLRILIKEVTEDIWMKDSLDCLKMKKWTKIYEEVKKIIEEKAKEHGLFIEMRHKTGEIKYLQYLITDKIEREEEKCYGIIGSISGEFLQRDKKYNYKGTKELIDTRIRFYEKLMKERFGCTQ